MSAIRQELSRPRTWVVAGMGLMVVLFGSYLALAQEQPEEPEPPPDQTTTRPPFIIQNQFNTTSGGSLQLRSPGLMVQAGIAEATGQVVVEGNAVQPVPNFFVDTFEMLFMQLLEEITAFIQSLSTLIGGSPLGGVDLGELGGLTGT